MPEQSHRSALVLACAGLVALAVAMGIGRFAFTPLLPLMQADAGLSLTQAGWLASANYLGYLVGALTAGRSGTPLALLRSGLMLVVMTTALMGALASLPLWWLIRFVAGVASAWVLVGTAALSLAQLAAMGQPRLAGVVFAGVGGGIGLAGLVCHAIVQAGGGAVTGWWALAIAALAGTWFVWHAMDTPAPPPATGPAPGVAARINRRDHRRLVLCYGLFGFGYILPATFLPAQARMLVTDPALFGWVWPVFGAAALASTLLVVRRRVMISRRHLWAGAQIVMASGVLLPALWPQLIALLIAALCVGGTFMVITMLGLQEAHTVANAQARQLMAAMTAAFALGQLTGPLLVSALSEAGLAYEHALWLAAGALVLSALLLMFDHPQAHEEIPT